MEVTELVQYNLQIRVLTGRGAKGCQAAAIPMAFGNSDVTAGSEAGLFLFGGELCFETSPPLPLLLISVGLSLPPPSHRGHAGTEEGLGYPSGFGERGSLSRMLRQPPCKALLRERFG